MDCIILQNTYFACIDLSAQVSSIIPQANIPYMTEEALEVVDWLNREDTHTDCIIADIEACDGDTIDIFRRSAIQITLILTCSSPDHATRSNGLNVSSMLLKPVSKIGLQKALSQIGIHCS